MRRGWIAVALAWTAGIGLAGPAAADPGARPLRTERAARLPSESPPVAAEARPERVTLVVPIVDVKGAPVFCTRDHSRGRARPERTGGYRVPGLGPGKWVVSLDLAHERVDVIVTVSGDGDLVVPPVVVRNPCRALDVRRHGGWQAQPGGAGSGWAVWFGRRYSPRPGLAALPAVHRGAPR